MPNNCPAPFVVYGVLANTSASPQFAMEEGGQVLFFLQITQATEATKYITLSQHTNGGNQILEGRPSHSYPNFLPSPQSSGLLVAHGLLLSLLGDQGSP